jgi:hypothetical protein
VDQRLVHEALRDQGRAGHLRSPSLAPCAGATATVDVFDANIVRTMLDGGAANATACAGVYDESFTFYAST